MKKIISVLIVLSIVFSISISFADIPDIKTLNEDELYQLNRNIMEELASRNKVPSFTAPIGVYTAGQDFPVGKYVITAPSITYITLYNSMNDYKADKPIARKTTIYDNDAGKVVDFTDGMVVFVDFSDARFSPYTGLKFE